MQKKSKLMIAGLASLVMAAGAHAGVKYIGTTGGTESSIVDLSVPSVDGVVYTEATFEAAFGGDYVTAADNFTNGKPQVATWQLTTADQYVLEDIVSITKGDLLIDAGVVVRGQPRTNGGVYDAGALLIAAGSKIIAAGEATNPIVFTTASTTGGLTGGRASGASPVFWDQPGVLAPKSAEVAGLWGGVIVLGKAPTNSDRDGGITGGTLNAFLVPNLRTIEQVIVGYGSGTNRDTFSGTYSDGVTTYTNLVAYVTNDDRSSIEGVPAASSISLVGLDRFGGFDSDDNSGIIKYVSIRHGGSNLALNSEVNGLTLGGIGRGTQVSYVEIYGNTDDGLEIFGGTVNVDHLLVVGVQDDGIDLDTGYNGTIQFAVVIGGAASDKLIEWDGSYEAESVNGFANTNPSIITRTPISNYAVYNATLIGNTVGTGNQGLHIRDQSAGRLVNSLVVNAGTNLLEVDNRVAGNRSTTNNFATGLAEIVGVSFAKTGVTTASAWTNGGTDDATIDIALTVATRRNYFNIGADSNPGLATLPSTGLTGGQLITLVPNSGSASVGALDAVLEDASFALNATIDDVFYRGAFEIDAIEKWTSGWTAAALASVIVP